MPVLNLLNIAHCLPASSTNTSVPLAFAAGAITMMSAWRQRNLVVGSDRMQLWHSGRNLCLSLLPRFPSGQTFLAAAAAPSWRRSRRRRAKLLVTDDSQHPPQNQRHRLIDMSCSRK